MEVTSPMAAMTREQILESALRLACERIADGPQRSEEANTAEGWARVYVAAAERGATPGDVLGGGPEARPMTDAERQQLAAHLNVNVGDARLTP